MGGTLRSENDTAGNKAVVQPVIDAFFKKSQKQEGSGNSVSDASVEVVDADDFQEDTTKRKNESMSDEQCAIISSPEEKHKAE
mmetsp:Transcript_60577/g.89893  ORF Transcript_60577/g.89893 Transcript_60577/m.89893 type:complete len:83 (-) Transcript_60577:210-458(-)